MLQTDFLDINLAKLTKYQYIRRLETFFDSLKLQGSLDKQSREFLTRARRDRTWTQDGLKYFIRDMKKRAEEGEISESSIRNFYKPIRLFCSVHDIELSWKKITNTIPTGRRFANDRAPTVEEIKRLIEYPDRRIKPIVLTTSSSGIRLGAWNYLKWKHIEPIWRNDKVIAAKIIVYAGENEQYYSFITPEAFEALKEWMEYRKTSGEDINGESWLMRTVWDTTTTANRSIRFPKQMLDTAIKQLINRALRSEGLRQDKKMRRYEFKAIHGFRKFFQTNAERQMKSLDIMTLMGQDTGLAASYNKPTVEMLLDEYLKAVENLTINKTIVSEEMVKNQQALATQMESKDQEVRQLKEQMNKMGNVVNKLDSFAESSKLMFLSYWSKFGGSLTDNDKKRLEQMLEWMRTHPNNND